MPAFRDLMIESKLLLSGVATSTTVVFAAYQLLTYRAETAAHLESTAFFIGTNYTGILSTGNADAAKRKLNALAKLPST